MNNYFTMYTCIINFVCIVDIVELQLAVHGSMNAKQCQPAVAVANLYVYLEMVNKINFSTGVGQA